MSRDFQICRSIAVHVLRNAVGSIWIIEYQRYEGLYSSPTSLALLGGVTFLDNKQYITVEWPLIYVASE